MQSYQAIKSSEDKLLSPCIRNCCLDEHDVCLGCFRSLDEITGWTQADEQTRQRFLTNAKSREQHYRQT